jgi:hypothetical protein
MKSKLLHTLYTKPQMLEVGEEVVKFHSVKIALLYPIPQSLSRHSTDRKLLLPSGIES